MKIDSRWRAIFGGLAALGAAGVAGDAWASANGGKWPLLHKLFDGDWNAARNLLYAISSMMAKKMPIPIRTWMKTPAFWPMVPNKTL